MSCRLAEVRELVSLQDHECNVVLRCSKRFLGQSSQSCHRSTTVQPSIPRSHRCKAPAVRAEPAGQRGSPEAGDHVRARVHYGKPVAHAPC